MTFKCMAMGRVLGSSLFLLVACLQSKAASIQLFNTGVDGSGALLPNSTIDPHYSLISAPGGFNAAYTGNGSEIAGGLPWLAEGPNSRWVSPSGWLAEWRPTGTYVYRTSFDLTGMVPGSAVINLSIASDNTCDVFLNGVHTGITTSFTGFNSFSNYSITSGFINGLNTLDFSVYEPGSTPSGLRIEIAGYATTVPEPSLLGLAGITLVAMVFRSQKSK